MDCQARRAEPLPSVRCLPGGWHEFRWLNFISMVFDVPDILNLVSDVTEPDMGFAFGVLLKDNSLST